MACLIKMIFVFTSIFLWLFETHSSAVSKEPEYKIYVLKSKDDLKKNFGDTWIEIIRFNGIDRAHLSEGLKIRIPVKMEKFSYNPMPDSCPEAEQCPKFILVNLQLQFLGAYEYGKLKFSCPISSGKKGCETPSGKYYIYNFQKNKFSSKYFIYGTKQPYPMTWSLQLSKSFKEDTNLFIHGRDLPGLPASRGCIGLYDEEMQKKYRGYPLDPVLMDAKKLFLWAIASEEKSAGRMDKFPIPVRIIEKAP